MWTASLLEQSYCPPQIKDETAQYLQLMHRELEISVLVLPSPRFCCLDQKMSFMRF